LYERAALDYRRAEAWVCRRRSTPSSTEVSRFMRVPLLLAVALALVSRAAPATAQTSTDRIVSFGIGGGVSVPLRHARDAYRNGFNGQAYVRLDLGSIPLSFRGDFTFQSFELQSSQFVGVSGATGGTGTLVGGLASAQVYLLRGAVRPYLVAGLGAYAVRTELDGTTLPVESDRHFGLNGGVGLLATIGVLSVYAEGHVDNVYAGRAFDQRDAIQLAPMTLGIVF
jgi:hypothetical protein